MDDIVRGTIILCDQIYEDRGRLSLLGAGWDLTAPGKRLIETAVLLDLRIPETDQEIEIDFVLRELDDDSDSLASMRIKGTAPGFVENPESTPPSRQVQNVIPMEWRVDLAPGTDYVIEMIRSETVLACTAFSTYTEEDAERIGAESPGAVSVES